MGKIIRKSSGKCQIEIKEINGRITMKCKNLKRKPTEKEAQNFAQELINSIPKQKIIYK